MQLLYIFEKLRMPWLDSVMLVITQFGGEILFMALSMSIFWCVSKRLGFYIFTVGYVGTVINQALKLMFRISRPWVQDPNFTIVEGARADATGYSFPSGHTQNAASVMLCPALLTERKWLKAVLWTLYFLVAVSRMYLGVHTPLDVGVSLALGLILVFALRPLFRKELTPGRLYALGFAMLGLTVAYIAYTELYPFPADIETENLEHGVKNGYTLLGALLGMLAGCWVDNRFVHFKTEGSLPAQIVKVALGLGLVVGIRVALKSPLNALFGGRYIADTVRYFFMVLFAIGIWPMAFPKINALLPRKSSGKAAQSI